MPKKAIFRKRIAPLNKLQDDTELRSVALWLTTLPEDETDEFTYKIKELREKGHNNSYIARKLFADNQKELRELRDFNERWGQFFNSHED